MATFNPKGAQSGNRVTGDTQVELTSLLLIALAIRQLCWLSGSFCPVAWWDWQSYSWSFNMMPVVERFGSVSIGDCCLCFSCLAVIKYAGGRSTFRPISLPDSCRRRSPGHVTLPGHSHRPSLTTALYICFGFLTFHCEVLPATPCRSRFSGTVALIPLVVVSLFRSPDVVGLLGDGRRMGVTANPNSLALLAGTWACLAVGVSRQALVVLRCPLLCRYGPFRIAGFARSAGSHDDCPLDLAW